MALSIFIDALPYSEIVEEYHNWFKNMQIAELQPNIAYSSSLHWQLYCNKYPDDRGSFVDWTKVPENNSKVKMIANILKPLDAIDPIAFFVKKVLDRVVFKKNIFANIPFAVRGDFSEKGEYLFWDRNVYSKEKAFEGYTVISQDEGHITFEKVIENFNDAIENKNKNIFVVFGFADSMGHKCKRGQLYHEKLHPYMEELSKSIQRYLTSYPNEEVVITSDHGMSTIEKKIELGLEKKFGKQGRNSYIAYCDSCMMCIWSSNQKLLDDIGQYLQLHNEGHLLTEEERIYYRVSDRRFGDLIYNLREGNVFANSWFGKGIRRHPDGEGMHGFWPERSAKDQMASIILINGHRRLESFYTYKQAHLLLMKIMQGEKDEIFPQR